MRIDFTWPDHLIPMVSSIEPDEYIVDLYINSILLENDEDVPRRLTRMVLDLMHDEQPLWRMEIPLSALVSHLAVDQELDRLPPDRRGNFIGEYLASQISQINENPTFKPGSQGLLRRFPIRFLSRAVPDTLITRAFSGSHLIGRASIPVTQFHNRMSLNFPVTGVWQTINNFDYTLGHRSYAGQEYAIDLVQIGSNGLLRKGESKASDDFFCYGAPVQAMSDGEVYQVENRLKDNDTDVALNDSDLAKSIDEYGYLAARSGNHVIIKHTDDRFSFYAHLQESSVTLSPGDTIKRGQVIGNIGNSGQSTKAHLHMQLNEGPNPLVHRGLPMTFDNLKDCYGKNLPLITQNNVMVHR